MDADFIAFLAAAGREPLAARFFSALGSRIAAPARERRVREAVEREAARAGPRGRGRAGGELELEQAAEAGGGERGARRASNAVRLSATGSRPRRLARELDLAERRPTRSPGARPLRSAREADSAPGPSRFATLPAPAATAGVRRPSADLAPQAAARARRRRSSSARSSRSSHRSTTSTRSSSGEPSNPSGARRYPHWQLCLADDGSTERAHARVPAQRSPASPGSTVSFGDANRGIAAATQPRARGGRGRVRRLPRPRRRARPGCAPRMRPAAEREAGHRRDLHRRGQDRPSRRARASRSSSPTGRPSSSAA